MSVALFAGQRELIWLSVIVVALCAVVGSPCPAGEAIDNLFNISIQQEKEIGGRIAAEIESAYKIERGPRAEKLARIGKLLAQASGNKDYNFVYRIISDTEINAFAAAGGYVYITSAMLDLMKNDDQIAAVLAHETTHVTERHYAKQYRKNARRQLGLYLLLKMAKADESLRIAAELVDIAKTNDYSRQYETDADLIGMEIMKRSGYNPHGMVDMLLLTKKLSADLPRQFAWTSDHPQFSVRIKDVQRREKELSR